MIARCDFWVAAGFRVLTRPGGARGGGPPPPPPRGPPPSLRFGHPDVATDGTDTSARKTPATTQHTEPRQPSPTPHAKHQPPGSRLKGDSPPPPQFARHGAHTKPRASTATPAGPQRTPNTDARRGAYILCRDIRVSELCEDGSPAGAKRIISPRKEKKPKK